MIGLLSNLITQNSVIRAFSNFYNNRKIYQISNIQKIVRIGQIVIEILKIQFWTRFFWTTQYNLFLVIDRVVKKFYLISIPEF